VRLRIVGHAAPPVVQALARPGTVEIVGPVPDLRPALSAARVVVAPVRFGTGMRGKVLEALALGRPVVTTTVGAEGLGARPGHHLLVADGAADFAAAVARVLGDPGFAAELGARGRTLVETRLDWSAIAAAHDAIYDAVLRDPPRAAPRPLASGGRLAPLAARLGYLPGLALGVGLLGTRALRWHARRPTTSAAKPVLDRPVHARSGNPV